MTQDICKLSTHNLERNSFQINSHNENGLIQTHSNDEEDKIHHIFEGLAPMMENMLATTNEATVFLFMDVMCGRMSLKSANRRIQAHNSANERIARQHKQLMLKLMKNPQDDEDITSDEINSFETTMKAIEKDARPEPPIEVLLTTFQETCQKYGVEYCPLNHMAFIDEYKSIKDYPGCILCNYKRETPKPTKLSS